MNDSSRVLPWRRGPRPTRTAAAIIPAAALVLLAACSGGIPSSAGSGGSQNAGGPANSPKALAYSRCMRSHGVPKYPDPGSNELPSGLPKVDPQRLGVSSSEYQAAERACAHVLPNGGQLSQAQSQRDLNAILRFARCMRSHGVPSWPDPTNGAAGWGFNLVHVHGFDPNSQQIDHKMSECSRQLPPGIGVPLARPGRPG